ncbi:MAG: DUF4908 domain-containing protein [Hyphomonadaceae bacterium]
MRRWLGEAGATPPEIRRHWPLAFWMMSEGARITGPPGGAVLTLTAAAMIAVVGHSAAETVSPLAQGLLGAPAPAAPPPAERFVTADGAATFVLDRSGAAPLLHVEGQQEVLALRPQSGPRGDEFLKTDTGRVVLRITAMGGITYYGDARSVGMAAAPSGASRPLGPPSPPRGGLEAGLDQLARTAARDLGRPVAFEAGGLGGAQGVGVAYDAAARAAEALASKGAGGVNRVVILNGPAPQARLQNDSLRVVVTPQMGYAGRPSSAAMEAALTR